MCMRCISDLQGCSRYAAPNNTELNKAPPSCHNNTFMEAGILPICLKLRSNIIYMYKICAFYCCGMAAVDYIHFPQYCLANTRRRLCDCTCSNTDKNVESAPTHSVINKKQDRVHITRNMLCVERHPFDYWSQYCHWYEQVFPKCTPVDQFPN